MKGGRTRRVETCAQAVDLETGTKVAVGAQAAERGDARTGEATLEATAAHLEAREGMPVSEEPQRRGRLATRRLWLRGQESSVKRLLVHAAGFSLGW